MKKRFYALCAAGLIAGGTALMLTNDTPVEAADHTDPEGVVAAGDSVDIGDFYAWHDTANDTLTLVLTYAGPQAPSAENLAVYDADALYGIHLDNDDDNVDDIDIWVRYGMNSLGEWGIQVSGLPGEAGPVEGAVGTTITGDGGAQVHAGLFDDPFFFDLAGFNATVANIADTADDADLAFTGADGFAGFNVSAIVIEVPLNAALGGGASTTLGMWASASTFTGGN